MILTGSTAVAVSFCGYDRTAVSICALTRGEEIDMANDVGTKSLAPFAVGITLAHTRAFSGAPLGIHRVGTRKVERFTLLTLGRLTILSPDGSEEASLSKRRLKLALLLVLAVAKRPMSRATLVELFWGDQDDARARHSLSDALSHLRRVLGRSAITTNDQDVALESEAPLLTDAVSFAEAIERRDFARACELYTGALLDGVEVEASPSFEHWLTRERRRLESLFFQACQQQCMTLARSRRWDECTAVAHRWLDASPHSVDAALFLLNALKAPGTREAAEHALGAYTQLSRRLAREFESAPDPAVAKLAESIRQNLPALASAPTAPEPVPTPETTSVPQVAAAPPNENPPEPAQPVKPPARDPASLRPHLWFAAAAALLAVISAMLASDRKGASQPASTRPRIAVAVQVRSSDSSIAWLADGLPQLITAKLARSPDVEVVPSTQVRALVMRRNRRNNPPDTVELRDIARRLGVTFFANGQMVRDGGSLVLDLKVLDAKSGRLVRTHALSRADALSLADEAAAKVLAAANAQRPGLPLADLETSSVEAYEQFVRANLLSLEGRYDEAVRALDAAIELDSGFASAIHARLGQAAAQYEPDVVERLQGRLRRIGDRATEFDRLRGQLFDAFFAGESERSEALARQLVMRYPQDTRAYHTLHDILIARGRWAASEEMWQSLLARDSLAMETGTGPCAPCAGYGVLVQLRLTQGKWQGAEHAARRWLELQPDAPSAWAVLATVLSATQRHNEALEAIKRAVSLTGDVPAFSELELRLMIAGRRYDTADSVITAWTTGTSQVLRHAAHDLHMLLLRERGELRAANIAVDRVVADSSSFSTGAVLLRGSNLARLGRFAAAASVYELSIHGNPPKQLPFPLPAASARGFCWHHALLADAIAPAGDTVRLRALADSLAIGCAQSYYWRDRILHHHVRGLIAMHGRRWAEAEREFLQARWGVGGTWTRTNAALAKVQLELGRPNDALTTLRDAHASPLDAMGRYQPRSELDYLSVVAFRQGGMSDSASVYEAHVRRAWRDADPEVKQLLATLGTR